MRASALPSDRRFFWAIRLGEVLPLRRRQQRLRIASHIKQAVCARRLFYAVTLGGTEALERIVAAREPQRLPVVLSADKIVQFLEAL